MGADDRNIEILSKTNIQHDLPKTGLCGGPKEKVRGPSLVVQWLGLCASTASGKEFACWFRSHKRGGFYLWVMPLEEGMATHSSILAWRISWTVEPGGLQSIGWQSWTWGMCLSMHTWGLRSGKPRGQKKKKRRRRSEDQVLLLETEQTPWGNPLKQLSDYLWGL